MVMSGSIASAIVAWAFVARADGLSIQTMEHGPWAAAVATMQTDLHSEGEQLHIVVRDGNGRVLNCGEYTLALDPQGNAAFDLEGCAASTGQTTLTLEKRTALFDHEGGVSRPRAIGIVATRVETAQTGGGAHVEAGSKVSCEVTVQPFLPDLENGTKTALGPDRYKLEVHDDDVKVTQEGTHWKVARAAGGPLSASYEVRDTKTGEIVLRDSVSFACGASDSHDTTLLTGDHTTILVRDDTAHSDAAALPSKPWEGHSWSLNMQGGIALLRPTGMQLQNSTGYTSAQDIAIGNTAATSLGLGFVYERPWLYASFSLSFAFASQGERTVFEYGTTETLAVAFHFGPMSAYVGPNSAVYDYQISGPSTLRSEWGSGLAIGVGGSAGLRAHVKNDDGTIAVFGIELTAPIAGNQPLFIMASLGWGAGH